MAKIPCEYSGGGTSELIATTGTAQSVNVVADYSKYDFLYLSIGAGTGNYSSAILPVATFAVKKALVAYVFGLSGQFAARCNFDANTTPNTLATSDTSYPASLYGIKMN